MRAEAALENRTYIRVGVTGKRAPEVRNEYFDGAVIRMAGASDQRELVALNFAAILRSHLKGKPCRVFKEGMKLRMRAMASDLLYYPGIMVTCDPTDHQRYYH
jgi:Putative restriction endonuclease